MEGDHMLDINPWVMSTVQGVIALVGAALGATRFDHRHRHIALSPLGFAGILVVDSVITICLSYKPTKFGLITGILRVVRLFVDFLHISRVSPFFCIVIGLVDLFWAHEELFKARKYHREYSFVPEVGKAVLVIDINIQIALLFVGEDPHSLAWTCWGLLVVAAYTASNYFMVQAGAKGYSYMMTVCLAALIFSANVKPIRGASVIALIATQFFDARQLYPKDKNK
jgi:hypothetical protein